MEHAKHIRLLTTHKLIYKIILGIGALALVIGLGMIFTPNQFFSANYTVLDDILPIQAWGVLWLCTALVTLGGLMQFSYLFVRIGLSGLTSLFGVWSVGIFMNEVFNMPAHGLTGGFVYATLAYICFSLIKEPPINPETAIKIKHNETE